MIEKADPTTSTDSTTVLSMPTFTHNPKEIEDDMAGVKRNYDGVKKEGGHEAPEAVAGASKEKQKSNRPYVKNDVKKGYESDGPVSPFMGMFETFRDELDEHHDRRERIIKASRDITAASKKMYAFLTGHNIQETALTSLQNIRFTKVLIHLHFR